MTAVSPPAPRSASWTNLAWWAKGLIGLLALYTVAHLVYSVTHYTIFSADMYRSRDFHRVFVEAQSWLETGVYPNSEVRYPPLYYLLLWPLTGMDFRAVTYLLYALQFLYFPAAGYFLVKAISPTPRPSALEYLLAMILIVNFQPFLETLAQHKVEGIEWLLICAALYAFRQRRDVVTGALICLAANLKYLPALLMFYFIWKREWKAVQGIAWMLAGIAAILLFVIGPERLWTSGIQYAWTFFAGSKIAGTRPEGCIEFQNLAGTVYRWFVDTNGMLKHFDTEGYIPVSHPRLALAIATSLKALLTVGYLAFVRRAWPASQRPARWNLYLIEISFTLLMIFVLASAGRVHYAILLLPAFLAGAFWLYHHPDRFPLRAKLLFWLAYGLTAMIVPGGLLNRLPPHPVWGTYHYYYYLWMSMPFYGDVLLGFFLWWCYRTFTRTDG